MTTDNSYTSIIKDFAKKHGVSIRTEQEIIDEFRSTVDYLNTHLEIMPDFMFQLKIARRWNRSSSRNSSRRRLQQK